MKKILVTGANGQLGKSFQQLSRKTDALSFIFTSSTELDISKPKQVTDFFKKHKVDYCINCAAYTNVEAAETDAENAFLINADAVKQLAQLCKAHHVTLIHFSTDYVFSGIKKQAYVETDKPEPLNVYGRSKLAGEQYIQDIVPRYFIIRTSWLYSTNGKNFLKTILNKTEEPGSELFITGSQKGAPTCTIDLAEAALAFIKQDCQTYGLYHFSNTGEASWYDFAQEIVRLTKRTNQVKIHESDAYKTKAKRPAYSVLNTQKITETLGLNILSWQESLVKLYQQTNQFQS